MHALAACFVGHFQDGTVNLYSNQSCIVTEKGVTLVGNSHEDMSLKFIQVGEGCIVVRLLVKVKLFFTE